MSADDHLGKQFEKVGYTNTTGVPMARGIANFNSSTGVRQPDVVDERRYLIDSDAARRGGAGSSLKLTEGTRQPHTADWMEWHMRAGLGLRPKLSWN